MLSEERRGQLKEFLSARARAEAPADLEALSALPEMRRLFPEDELLSLVFRVTDKDGVPYVRIVSYEPDDPIIRAQTRSRVVCWVLSGSAHALRAMGEGPPVIVRRYGPGECFGELGAITGEIRKASVAAGEGGATLLGVDWEVCELSSDLRLLLDELLLKSMARTLDGSFDQLQSALVKACERIHRKDAEIRSLRRDNQRLRQGLDLARCAIGSGRTSRPDPPRRP